MGMAMHGTCAFQTRPLCILRNHYEIMIARQDEQPEAYAYIYLGGNFAISMLQAMDFAPEWAQVRMRLHSAQ